LPVASGLLLTSLIYIGSPQQKSQRNLAPEKESLSLNILGWFIAIFLMQTSIKVVIGSWSSTHLIRQGSSLESTARVISLFWVLITLARFIAVPLSLWLKPSTLIVFSFALTFVFSFVDQQWTHPAYTAMGFSMGPPFPLLIAWIGQHMSNARQATFAITGASIWFCHTSAIGWKNYRAFLGRHAATYHYCS
jgi:fucose permease